MSLERFVAACLAGETQSFTGGLTPEGTVEGVQIVALTDPEQIAAEAIAWDLVSADVPWSDAVAEIEDLVIQQQSVERGGPGSGHFGHEGRPGERGGSAPGGGGEAEPYTVLGITSFKEGRRTNAEVFQDMRDFHSRLNALAGVRAVRVKPGLGGYQGGREGTWLVRYNGNGEAIRLAAETAQQFDQDAVIVLRQAREGNSMPVVDWTFDRPVTPRQRDAAEAALVAAGIGGWTWRRQIGGPTVLRAAAVREFGATPESHLASAARFTEAMNRVGVAVEPRTSEAAVYLMTREEGPNSYASVRERGGVLADPTP